MRQKASKMSPRRGIGRVHRRQHREPKSLSPARNQYVAPGMCSQRRYRNNVRAVMSKIAAMFLARAGPSMSCLKSCCSDEKKRPHEIFPDVQLCHRPASFCAVARRPERIAHARVCERRNNHRNELALRENNVLALGRKRRAPAIECRHNMPDRSQA